jgi:hypothetical protein
MRQLTPILRPLRRLHRREQLLGLIWGLARIIAVVLAALFLACLIDWWIDRRHDTPMFVRIGLMVVQAVVAVVSAIWLLAPAFGRRDDDKLALFVEDKLSAFNHRLISAVQLNRHNARTTHMSQEMIAAVTEEARQSARQANFSALVDHRRLKWAGWTVVGCVVASAFVYWIAPETVSALLARQFFGRAVIPRSIRLTNHTVPVQPAAEPVTLRLAVDGPWPGQGELRIATGNGAMDRLTIDSVPVDGVVTMTIPAPPGDFAFEAWVGDGRLREPGHVKLVPRPAVTSLSAAMILPSYCGLTPEGNPYEQLLPRGEVSGIVGCSAWVFARTQNPVARAVLELLSVGAQAQVTRTLSPTAANGTDLTFRFDLRENESAYRILLWDENNFANLDPPRRDVRLLPEEPPTVTLLPEQFKPEGFSGSADEFEADGVPVPLGGAIRTGYTANHGYGLGHAALVYRINDGDWHRLGLTESQATGASGPFDPKRGCFENNLPGDQVQFHAVPSPDVMKYPGRLDGGGRFDFQTRSLPGIKVGDQIDYFVEVTNRNPDSPLAGRSETRSKRIVTVTELVEWIDATLRQEDRIRRLTDRQRGVFDR